MTCRELFSYLTADLKFPADDMKELESKLSAHAQFLSLGLLWHISGQVHLCAPCMFVSEREINGEAFCHSSREDIATIFPDPKQFILASKLYKVVQHARSSLDLSNARSTNVIWTKLYLDLQGHVHVHLLPIHLQLGLVVSVHYQNPVLSLSQRRGDTHQAVQMSLGLLSFLYSLQTSKSASIRIPFIHQPKPSV